MREQKRKGFYIIIPLVIITLITLTAASYYLKNAKAEDDIAYRNKILRFHVIANSDSPEDQALKEGVKKEILSITDEKIYIKMNNKCESLNAGVAASIILYELSR